MQEQIQVGFQAFLADGGEEFGAIRSISKDKKTLTLYVENAGEFQVSADAVSSVHSEKVIFQAAKLDSALLKAIRHAHDAETE